MTWTFAQAQEAMHEASRNHREACEEIARAGQAAAAAERAADVAIHRRAAQLRADGVASSSCVDIAKREPEISDLRAAARAADAVYQSARAAAQRRLSDRADTRALADWAMRREQQDGSLHDDQRLAWSGTGGAA